MLTITQAARRAACSASTIRYYERVGLLPAPRRGENNYRYYEPADIDRLTFVNRARELGFSIESVAELLRLANHPDAPCEAVDSRLAKQLDSVQQRIRQLRELESRLIRLQKACSGDHPIHECGILAALSDMRRSGTP